MKPTIRIVHNLARSGGTIINRCLACMDGIVLLSEVDPHTKDEWNSAPHQARAWYGYQLGPEPCKRFDEEVERIHAQLCKTPARALVIRSWDVTSFIPTKFCPAPGLLSVLAVALARFDLWRVAIVREPIAMWRSLAKYQQEDVASGLLTVDNYLRGYRAFAEMALKTGFVRYEDFCVRPGLTLEAMCCQLDLPFDLRWTRKWAGYHNLTGDHPGMGIADNSPTQIQPANRIDIPEEMCARFVAHPDYLALCRMLGY
jgi:hypothetical protein